MKNQIDPNEYQDPGLKRLLELLEPVPPRSAAEETQTRAHFMAELDVLFESNPEKPASRLPKWLQSILPTQRRQPYASHRFAFSTLMALIAVFALLFGGAGATALASQASIPGDVLYPVKTGLEGAQLSLAAGAYAEAQLHLSFAQRRLDEIAGLIEAGRIAEIDAAAAEFQRQIDHALENLRTLAMSDPVLAADLANQITSALSQYAQVLSGLAAQAPETIRPALQQALQSTSGQVLTGEVEFTGVLEAMTEAVWTVAGRSVLITSATEFKGVMVTGDTVKVHAAPNADGTFTAREIELIRSDGDDHGGDDDQNENEGDDDAGGEASGEAGDGEENDDSSSSSGAAGEDSDNNQDDIDSSNSDDDDDDGDDDGGDDSGDDDGDGGEADDD